MNTTSNLFEKVLILPISLVITRVLFSLEMKQHKDKNVSYQFG